MTKQELERRRQLWEQGYWEIPGHIDDSDFNYAWRPHPTEPPQIYQFGTQWQRTGGPRFVIPESVGVVYCDTQRVKTLPRPELFSHPTVIEVDFDYSWHPDDTDLPYIYVFGCQHYPANELPLIEYYSPGGRDKKFMDYPLATVEKFNFSSDGWRVLIEGATLESDWFPSPYDPPFIYVFGNKWNDGPTEPTIEYVVPGATDRKYIANVVAELPQRPELWTVPNKQDLKTFDFSWRPNPYSPQQTYQWENNGPIFKMPGSTATVFMTRSDDNDIEIPRYYIETTVEELIEQHPDEVFWALDRELKYDKFNFNWRPTPENFMHLNDFGGTYYVNGPAWMSGRRDINYADDDESHIETDIDMFYIIRGSQANQYEELLARFPRLQKTRYMNSWVDTINRCVKKSTSKFMWVLSSELDYTDFEFDYYPSQRNRNHVNVFGTQWSRWGNTYLINTRTFSAHTRYVKEIEQLSNVHHVRDKRTKISQCLYDVVYIDFGNISASLDVIKSKIGNRNVTVLKYDTSYYNTLKLWAQSLAEYEIRSEHLLWVCTSVTDYTDFDFTWVADPFQREQLHVFSAADDSVVQQFGDTFVLNLNAFRQTVADFTQLENYTHNINYVKFTNKTRRLPHPVLNHQHDSQADAVREIKDKEFPYVELVSSDAVNRQSVIPNLWDSEHSTVVVASHGARRIFVPTTAINRIQNEVYDWPYIETVDQPDASRLLDIVFFSNGEPNADENFEYLLSLGLSNKITHQRGVQGRVESQHAAAEASSTPWYFLVNAKLRVNPDFDFSWQPDRLQRAKHYIFMATNPVNGLEYGHQAIVANNRRLTLATQADGLDFTMSSAHEVVNSNCGTAYYNRDPWTTWRTAFREAIKLQYYGESEDGSENRDRLEAWLRNGNGENGGWSTGGAYDAVEYYKSVNGDLRELMRSYEWQWLREYYDERYGTK